MISNNNNVETSQWDRWAKKIEPRLTVNQNYIFLLVSINGLDPVYPAFLVVLLMMIPGLVIHNTIRFRFQQLINSSREQLDAIAGDLDCSALWYVVSHPWDAFKLCLLGTLVNISTAIIICLGPYYLSPFSVSPLTYFNLGLALLFDIAMLYLGDYHTYRYLDSRVSELANKELVNRDIATAQTRSVVTPNDNIDYTHLAQMNTNRNKNIANDHKSIDSKPKQTIDKEGSEEFRSLYNQLPNEIQYEKNSEPSISGFIKAETISEEDFAIDIIDTTVEIDKTTILK